MRILEHAKRYAADLHAADLHWLAFLLTGRREPSVEIAVETVTSQDYASPQFSTWMEAWARRIVIAKALSAIRGELQASAQRTKSKRMNGPALPAVDWALDQGTSKVELERALLAIDVFPRVALVLSVFEGVPVPDAAVLLDADPGVVKKARVLGLRELTSNLAKLQGWTSTASKPHVVHNETQHA